MEILLGESKERNFTSGDGKMLKRPCRDPHFSPNRREVGIPETSLIV